MVPNTARAMVTSISVKAAHRFLFWPIFIMAVQIAVAVPLLRYAGLIDV
jgi:hypothetical protein